MQQEGNACDHWPVIAITTENALFKEPVPYLVFPKISHCQANCAEMAVILEGTFSGRIVAAIVSALRIQNLRLAGCWSSARRVFFPFDEMT